MSCLDRYFRSSHVPLVCLFLATALLQMLAKLRGGQAQESPQIDPRPLYLWGFWQARESPPKDPWSVESWGLNPSHYDSSTYYPPSCHELSYFSGSPLRFDRGGELVKWKPGSYTIKTKVDLLGSSQGHRIYQALKEILPQGCQVKGNRNGLDLEKFRFLAAVEPIDKDGDTAYCEGAVRLELGIKNHRIVVEDKQYTP